MSTNPGSFLRFAVILNEDQVDRRGEGVCLLRQEANNQSTSGSLLLQQR